MGMNHVEIDKDGMGRRREWKQHVMATELTPTTAGKLMQIVADKNDGTTVGYAKSDGCSTGSEIGRCRRTRAIRTLGMPKPIVCRKQYRDLSRIPSIRIIFH